MGRIHETFIQGGVLRIGVRIQQLHVLASLVWKSSVIRMDCKVIGTMKTDTGHDV